MAFLLNYNFALLSFLRKLLFLLFLSFSLISFSQIDPSTTLVFDFNEHIVKEDNNKVTPRAEGITLTADRFGNEKSAIYIHGNVSSYLNLSSSKLLKPNVGTISLWVNLDRRVYSGKGYDNNPIIYTKNGQVLDFNLAYAIAYDCYAKKIIAYTARDSLKESIASSESNFRFGNWYHLVISFDDEFLFFYVNGILQTKARKGFATKYLDTDSVMIGHTASVKNERYSQGVFDDIFIFHRVLDEHEIRNLYNAPNPNKIKNIVLELFKYGIIILILILIIIAIIFRNKKALKRQKEQLELVNKISELELKVVKAQMNPHFISNCLAAIQELIYKNNVDKAGQYIAKFSYFLRQILNYSDKNFISISEEIEIIKLNVELEKLRFKNEFQFQLFVNENVDITELLIPALITQPFIENAIWHGLLPLNNIRDAKLIIRILIENELPIIIIEDNGIGRDLRKKTNRESKGTKLILDKIESLNRLYNTSNYSIEIVDLMNDFKEQIGTKIIIHLDNIRE